MNANRIYSTVIVKAVDEDAREIKGIASTPSTDRVGDIVDPAGAMFSLPMPFLWQHKHDSPIGSIVRAKVTAAGIEIVAKLVAPTDDMPSQLFARLQEAWASIKSGLVRGLSIGFRPMEYAFIDEGGVRFTKYEIFEISAVTIPANGDASITSIKSFDDQQLAAIGKKLPSVVRLDTPAGASAKTLKTPNPKPQEGQNMNIQDQIKSFQDARGAKSARMQSIMEEAGDAGATLDAAQAEEYDGLDNELKSIDSHLKRLTDLEQRNVSKATPVEDVTRQRHQVQALVKAAPKLEPGIEFARYAMCHLAAKGNPDRAFALAKRHYGDSERVVNTLKAQADGYSLAGVMKATVEAGTSIDPTWAAPLVEYQTFAGDFVDFLRPRTIIGQFGVGAVPTLNRIPFNVRIAGQTSGGTGYWVGEGAPKPLTAFDFNATELRWAKVATIAVLTNELIRFSDPSAERLVRDALAAAVIERIDVDFVDPAKAAVAGVSPASITNGATAVVSSGTDADSVRADLRALWAPFIAARNAPRNAVYIMDSTIALSLSLMLSPLGQPEFPGLTLNGGTFMGIPVIVSDYVPTGVVVLANASDIWLADDGQVTIDASQEASLQMLDNPTNNSGTGTATSLVSMFQTNSTAFRAERYINWARRRASGVAYLTGVAWGTEPVTP